MKAPAEQVLREAARDQHPNETFEKSLSRTVRTYEGTFQEYLDLIEKVRKRARKDKSPLSDAAKALAAEIP